MLERRKLIAGLLTGLIAAPMVIRDASVLMPVRKLTLPPEPIVWRSVNTGYIRLFTPKGKLVYMGPPDERMLKGYAERIADGRLII